MLSKLNRLFTITVFCAVSSVQSVWADNRVALVIGNSDYTSSPKLANPANDAQAISAKLTSLGFEVTEGYDLGYDALRDTVRSFAGEARDADLSVFYYAGHGIAVDGENYIVPVDARMDDPVDWEFEVYAMADVTRILERSAGPSLVFLDACRDNPMAQTLASAQGMSSRSLNTRGLSRMPTEHIGTKGTVIAYATEPGQVAKDGEGQNSPFTTALLRHIGTANTDFVTLTSRITGDVLDLTDQTQRPRFDVSLTGPLILNEVAVAAPAADPVAPAQVAAVAPVQPAPANDGASLEIQKIVFQTAAESGDAADYQAYLDAYPNGAFAVLARNAIARLEVPKPAPAAAAPVVTAAATRMVMGPLVLTPTATAKLMPSSDATESLLNLTKSNRREVQIRLNLSGNNVGRADGVIGKGTRGGLRNWQAQNGFVPTGYLNAVQHQLLVASTEQGFVAYIAANPTALAPPVKKKVVKRTSTGTVKRKSTPNSDLGAFVGGLAAGMLLRK